MSLRRYQTPPKVQSKRQLHIRRRFFNHYLGSVVTIVCYKQRQNTVRVLLSVPPRPLQILLVKSCALNCLTFSYLMLLDQKYTLQLDHEINMSRQKIFRLSSIYRRFLIEYSRVNVSSWCVLSPSLRVTSTVPGKGFIETMLSITILFPTSVQRVELLSSAALHSTQKQEEDDTRKRYGKSPF